MYIDKISVLSLFLFLGAVFGKTVACCDRQDSVLAASAVGTQYRNTERLRLHSRTAHTLLLHASPLQGVNRLTATFSLKDRQTDRQTDRWTDGTTGGDRNGGDGETHCYNSIELSKLIPGG